MKTYKYIVILIIFTFCSCNVNCNTISDQDEILKIIIPLTYWKDHNPVEAVFTDSIYTLFNNELNSIIKTGSTNKGNNVELDGMTFLMNSYYDDQVDEQRWNYRRALYFGYKALISDDEYKESFIKIALASLHSFECKKINDDLVNVWLGLNLLKIILTCHEDIDSSILMWLENNTKNIPIESFKLVTSKL